MQFTISCIIMLGPNGGFRDHGLFCSNRRSHVKCCVWYRVEGKLYKIITKSDLVMRLAKNITLIGKPST